MPALIAEARALLGRDGGAARGSWPRVISHLTRQALEGLLDELWVKRAPGLENASMRAQLVCLGSYLGDPALAGRIACTWADLSKSCHLHAYDLAPSAAMLERWLGDVEELSARL